MSDKASAGVKHYFQTSSAVASMIMNNFRLPNGDLYSANDFDMTLYTYPADNTACQESVEAEGCPSVKVAQEVMDAASLYTAMLANNIHTLLVRVAAANANPDLGEIEFSVGIAASPATGIAPSSSYVYKRTWKLAPNRDVYIAFDEANMTVMTAFYRAIANIESPITGQEKPVKLGEAKTSAGITYARSFIKQLFIVAREQAYQDFRKGNGTFIPVEIEKKLGNKLLDNFANPF